METRVLLHTIKMGPCQQKAEAVARQPRQRPDSSDRMLPSLKAVVALLSLLQLISSTSVAHLHKQMLGEITHQVRQLNSQAQVPCNDTRVAQVPFTNPKLSEKELLCQAAKALTKVTRCKDYEPLVTNLQKLQGRTNCLLNNETEIYLRHFLPALGNFTQGMYRRPRASAAQ